MINETCQVVTQEESELNEQVDRIVEYEKELLKDQGRPLLAAMFLLYTVVSVALISIIIHMFF